MARHEKPVLLFAFANDRQVEGRYLRELPEEQRRVLRAVGAARQEGRCEPHALPHATVDDLAEVLLGAEYGERIAVFHFGGHAGDGALLLESGAGAVLPAFPEGLATLLGNRESVQLVFLNGCSTQAQAETFLNAGVPAVIATSEAIDDATARDLAWRFYQGLAAGRSVVQAFEEATALLVMRFGKSRHQAYHRSFQPRDPQPDWPWRLFGDGSVVPIPLADDLAPKSANGVKVSPEASPEPYDLYLSAAAADDLPAERLKALLERQGRRVYRARGFVSDDLRHADDAPALASARVAVFLVSERSERDDAVCEDALLALGLEHQGQLERVVPVYVAGKPDAAATWDLGLRRYDHADWRRQGAEAIARKLGALIVAAEPVMDAHQELRTFGAIFHHAALQIDRERQWLPIVDTCRTQDDAIFLLRGPRQQNLDLFVSRIWHYLTLESRRHHRPVVVPRKLEYATPRSVPAWENHLRHGLAEEGQAGTALMLLREAARQHPVFLVFGQVPISRGCLDDEELDALVGFLRGRLPELMASASAGAHPIRALIATHYEDESDSLVGELDQAAYQGTEGTALAYLKLPPLQPLEWADIEHFLDTRHPRRPPLRVYRKLEAAWQQLDRGGLQFRDVVELLSRELF